MLSDLQILEEMEKGNIKIEPFDSNSIGTNSYDVHLGKTLATYRDSVLDCKKHNLIDHFDIPEEGFVLQPGELYLGVTQEYTETHAHVPLLEGKSSLGRLGLTCHVTAGVGDVGFCNHWTLEITVVRPLRVYAGMSIGQLLYFEIDQNRIGTQYDQKQSAKYNERCDLPKESMMWKNFT